MSDRDPYTIRMAHPAKNAIDADLIAWLCAELERAGTRPILLTGTDDAFCAGLNLERVGELGPEGMGAFLRTFDSLVARLFLHPAPTVAAVNGHAIAGGCVLALACDHRVVADRPRLKMGLNEVALGACFPPVTMRMIRARLSPHAIEHVLLGAGLFGPGEARELGLADALSDEVEADALERIALLSRHPAAGYGHTKRLLRAEAIRTDAEDERRFVQDELPQWTSPEIRERIRSVLGG